MIAVWDAADQWHLAAELGYKKLLLRGHPLVTTEMVLYECGNAAARRPYRPRVKSPVPGPHGRPTTRGSNE